MQCLILYSHQNDDVLNKLAATALKGKTLKFQQIKLDTIFKTSWSTLKGRGEVKFSGVFLSTTECYMIITNILKTIDLEEQ